MKKRHKWKRRAARFAAAPPQAEARMHAAASPPAVKFARASRASVWRGIALDLTVVAANLFLLAPLARILRAGGQGFLAPGKVVGGVVSSTVGWLFLSVFAAHAIGAYLKLLPRQADVAIEGATPAEAETKGATRRARRRRESAPTASPHANKFLVGVVLALLLFHFFIFLTLLFSGWQSTGLQGWSPLFGENAAENTYKAFFVRFVLIIFILPLPTALVAIGLGDGADVPPSTRRTYQATELLADVLLYFSIVVITLVMNVLIAPRFVSAGVGAGLGLGDVLASLIPLALAFSILYLPPRLIYLAKDYKSPLAWLTILLALLSLAYRTFFPDGGFSW